MPARSDLDPLKVPRLLPYLGLIDLRDGLDQGLFRLAGTRLRDVCGKEITRRRVGEVFAGDCATYWRRIHARVAEKGVRPMASSAGRPKDAVMSSCFG
jgi:hypothetical protein